MLTVVVRRSLTGVSTAKSADTNTGIVSGSPRNIAIQPGPRLVERIRGENSALKLAQELVLHLWVASTGLRQGQKSVRLV